MGEIAFIVINDPIQVLTTVLPQRKLSFPLLRISNKLAKLATIQIVKRQLAGTPIILRVDRWIGGTGLKFLPC
jgi:hypothetical protein